MTLLDQKPGHTARAGLVYDMFETSMGWVAAVASSKGVVRMSLPERSPEQAYDHVRPEIESAELEPEAFRNVRELVTAYCAGSPVDLTEIPIDTSGMSPFFRKAREACRSIPAGETRTYAWIADRAGNARAARGAGQAMAKNPVALLVPCHRVIGSDGSLHGFGGGVGLSLKSELLRMEAGSATAVES